MNLFPCPARWPALSFLDRYCRRRARRNNIRIAEEHLERIRRDVGLPPVSDLDVRRPY